MGTQRRQLRKRRTSSKNKKTPPITPKYKINVEQEKEDNNQIIQRSATSPAYATSPSSPFLMNGIGLPPPPIIDNQEFDENDSNQQQKYMDMNTPNSPITETIMSDI